MATIRKRGEKWHVQVRVSGYPAVTRSFHKKADAEVWAKNTESDMERGRWHDPRPAQQAGFVDVLENYINKVSPTKKGKAQEVSRLRLFQGFPPFRKPLSAINPMDVMSWVTMRERAGVNPMTIRRDVATLSAVFKHCVRKLGYIGLENPAEAKKIMLPEPPQSAQRNRLARDGELDAILAHTGSALLMAAVRLAVETAMRRSEIVSIRWENVDLNAGVVRLPETKNGTARDVALSPAAVKVFRELHKGARLSPWAFPSPRKPEEPIRADAITRAWIRARDEAAKTTPSVRDLRIHDLRHTATTAFFQHQAGLNVIEVATMTGHKDLRSLNRYSHIPAEHLREKLGWSDNGKKGGKRKPKA